METVKNTETLTFEQAMEQLELVVRRLDNGELPLKDAITSFQDGLEYIKVCQEKLNKAEGKLAMFRDGRFEIQ
ncbi:MAG: exodeoxyribonuclease VII small subunit [Peptococcaceae bacterium]|nr:exodeoxyribonuclease VII small subunit [Peptococcaceae bacterium]